MVLPATCIIYVTKAVYSGESEFVSQKVDLFLAKNETLQ